MYKSDKVKKQSRWRLLGGFALMGLFAIALVVHVAGQVEFNEVALVLLICVVGSILFALSQQLGITKVTAGPLNVEIKPLVEEAVAELPSDQTEEVWRVLEKHSDLFPVIGVRLLWIDDKPESLIPQRRLLRRLGIDVVAVRSTDAAETEMIRDSDFALIIQDRIRDINGERGVTDAQALVEWLDKEGVKYKVKETPLIVFSFDRFDRSIGVQEWNWITRDFASLLNRIANEVKRWKQNSPGAEEKPVT